MSRYRLILLFLIFFLIPMGLIAKFYQGLFQDWINDSFSSLFYVMFWMAVVLWVKPELKPTWVAVWVFIFTSFLEVLQLWQPPFLTAIRSTLIGRLVLGTTFVPSDFLYYAVGCGLGAGLFSLLKSRCRA